MNHPKGTDPDTRQRLLTAARGLFAAQGYEGTSVRDITGAAQANLGAVTYHFGSKQALYEAVISSFVDPMRDRVDKATAAPGTALDRIELVVRALMEHFDKYPEQPAIMLHELARQNVLPRPVQDWISYGVTTLAGLIAEGQAEGVIIAGPPLPMVMSVIAQPFFFAITKRPWGRTPGLKRLRASRAATPDLTCALIRRSLEAPRRKP
jgi:AcrR family transcriptional regulator